MANTTGLHPCVELTLALTAAHRDENVARQTFTHMATEVKVLEQEGVGLIELLAVADVVHFGFFAHDNFEVHYFASLHVFHLEGKHALLLVYLFEAARAFPHLQLERFPDEVEQTRAHPSTLTSFLLFT